MCFILPIKKKCLASHARLKGKLLFKLQGSTWWFAHFLLISHSLDCKCLWRHDLKAADLTRGVPNIWVFLEWTFFWTFCVRHAGLITGQNSELPAVVLTTWSKSSTDVASTFLPEGLGAGSGVLCHSPGDVLEECPVTRNGTLVAGAGVPKWVFYSMPNFNEDSAFT